MTISIWIILAFRFVVGACCFLATLFSVHSIQRKAAEHARERKAARNTLEDLRIEIENHPLNDLDPSEVGLDRSISLSFVHDGYRELRHQLLSGIGKVESNLGRDETLPIVAEVSRLTAATSCVLVLGQSVDFSTAEFKNAYHLSSILLDDNRLRVLSSLGLVSSIIFLLALFFRSPQWLLYFILWALFAVYCAQDVVMGLLQSANTAGPA